MRLLIRFLKKINQSRWVLHLEPPMDIPAQVVRYIGRYSKRACLSEYKITKMEGEKISFRYKDYKTLDKDKKSIEKELELHYRDFFPRLLQHVPLRYFRIVRYYGMYANKSKIREEFLYKDENEAIKGALIRLLPTEYDLTNFEKSLKIFSDQLFIYVDGAGKGKTNFICDLVDRFVLSHNIPSVFLNGTDFSNSNKLLDVIINNVYGIDKYNEEQFLKNIKLLCKKQDSFFIIFIDAINEHNNILSFSQQLNTFVNQMCSNYPFIKFMLTVRSEHYKERFHSLNCLKEKRHVIINDDINMRKRVFFTKEERAYVECCYVLKKYLSFFSLKGAFYFAPNMVSILGNNLLLLRIFCEVNRKTALTP